MPSPKHHINPLECDAYPGTSEWTSNLLDQQITFVDLLHDICIARWYIGNTADDRSETLGSALDCTTTTLEIDRCRKSGFGLALIFK